MVDLFVINWVPLTSSVATNVPCFLRVDCHFGNSSFTLREMDSGSNSNCYPTRNRE